MNLLPLLDELRTIARNGLTYAQNEYDRERYARLLELTSQQYADFLDLPTGLVKERLQAESGYITPKVGADAAIFDDEGRILLHLRADDQRWCLPCGWLEPNESPEEAVVRETWEETGLHVEPVELVGVFTRRPNPDWGLFTMVAVCFLCRVRGGELTLSHEGLDLAYWELDEVADWHGTHETYARAAHALWQNPAVRPRWTDVIQS
ncbi:MAG: NUDIX hydrolase N-terminal domain-containing protein [Caldilineaceae bacterium]|nr:NUDIX hydrolase N-terminal domain-containing protein [Caldilineaceae bacterium]